MNGQWGTQFIDADGSSGYVVFVTFFRRLPPSLSRDAGRNATDLEMTSADASSLGACFRWCFFYFSFVF